MVRIRKRQMVDGRVTQIIGAFTVGAVLFDRLVTQYVVDDRHAPIDPDACVLILVECEPGHAHRRRQFRAVVVHHQVILKRVPLNVSLVRGTGQRGQTIVHGDRIGRAQRSGGEEKIGRLRIRHDPLGQVDIFADQQGVESEIRNRIFADEQHITGARRGRHIVVDERREGRRFGDIAVRRLSAGIVPFVWSGARLR